MYIFSTRMLDEMENDFSTNNLSRLSRGTSQKSGGKHNYILIVVLSVVVIILLNSE